MPILSKGHTFADGDQVNSTKLNNLVENATFTSGAVDGLTLTLHASGYLQVGVIQTGNLAASSVTTAKIADSTGTTDGVTTAKLATSAVTTEKIADANVTTPKIADSNVTTAKIAAAGVTAAKLSGAQTGTAPVYGVRAWGHFDTGRNSGGGTDTANTARYLYASGNVTSVTRTASGRFAVAFATALPDANYAVVGVGQDNTAVRFVASERSTQATSGFTLWVKDSTDTFEDSVSSVTFYVMG